MPSLDSDSAGPVRVAFCITELDPGGAERYLMEVVRRHDRQRFHPVVYCLGPRPSGNPTSLADAIEAAGVKVHCFGARGVWHAPAVLAKLRRRLLVDRPQILQNFLFHANVMGAVAARRAGVPYVVNGIQVAERHARWHLTLARWVDRWVDRYVCVSQSVAEFSRQAGRLPADKLVVVAGGVDLDRFTASTPCPLETLGVKPDRRIIVAVGRLERQKNFQWLIDVLPRALAQLPAHDVVLVGDGPDRAELASQIERQGLADRVHLSGFRRDVPEILAASDLLVLPSKWEGMPNVVLEAMASALPVVATRAEGVEEALGPAAAEQVVAHNDAEAFAARMAAILHDPLLAARLGDANRDRVRQCFSAEAMARGYERLYATLLASDRA